LSESEFSELKNEQNETPTILALSTTNLEINE